MKIKVLSFIAIVASSLTASLNKVNSLNAVGLTTNSESNTVEAVTYGLANAMKMDDIYIQNSKDYKTPTIVQILVPSQNLAPTGETISVDEVSLNFYFQVASQADYYDGTKGLKITVTECNQYTTQPQVCTGSGSCGWCGATKTCVSGNSTGPLAPCLRGSYNFSAPTLDWNPLNEKDVTLVSTPVANAILTRVISNK